jgi:NAD(P)H-nitrite reductase large subunit
VQQIDRTANEIVDPVGRHFPYDKLLIAIGSGPLAVMIFKQNTADRIPVTEYG